MSEVADTTVTEVVVNEPSAVSEVQGVDADLTWDNVEDAAPPLTQKEEILEMQDEDAEEVVEPAEEVGEIEDAEVKEEKKEEKKEESDDVKEEVKADDNKAIDINELPDDTIIKAKVDGEIKEITLKEFKNGISGEKAIAKRFSEYDKKEKHFNQEMKSVNDYINDLGKTMRSSSVLEGVVKIGELTNMAPHQIKEALIKELLPEIERRYGMTDTEVNLELKTQENEYLVKKTESENKKLKAEQAQKDLDNQIKGIRETHQIDEDMWTNSIAELDAKLPKDEPITPDLVVEYVAFKRAENRAVKVLESFDKSYLSNENVVKSLIDSILENPKFTDEDFLDITRNAFGSAQKQEAQEAVEKKLGQKKKIEKAPAKKEDYKQLTKSSGEEALDWDDIL